MNTSILTLEEKDVATAERLTGAEAVIRCLLAEGVHTIFGYPGGAIMPIYDALYQYKDEVNHILVRHEQGAIHAAQGFARVSGEVGVCFATSGPGATNLITGIADSMIDSTPVVCITGQVASHLLGTDAFQETDVMGISMPVTKWNYQVTKAEEIPFALARAFYIARSGRPGPVLIDITKNAQFQELDFEYVPCTRIRSYHPYPESNEDKVQEAAVMIDAAKKPMLLVGQGVILSEAQNELIAFAEKTGIPMASTLLGLSAVSTDHPLYVGYLGMHGNYGPNVKTNECDLLIAVGMRFDDRVTGRGRALHPQTEAIEVRLDDLVERQPLLHRQLRRVAHLGVHDAVRREILGALGRDAHDGIPILEDAHGVLKRLEVQLERLPVRPAAEPRPELVHVVGRQARVAELPGEVDHRGGPQAAVQMVVEDGFRRFADDGGVEHDGLLQISP